VTVIPYALLLLSLPKGKRADIRHHAHKRVSSESAGFPRIALSLTLGENAMNFGLLLPQLPHTPESDTPHHEAVPSERANHPKRFAALWLAIKKSLNS
jgi:hypothetical protein